MLVDLSKLFLFVVKSVDSWHQQANSCRKLVSFETL